MKKLFWIITFFPIAILAQNSRLDYIAQYKDIAIREMKLYKIPASITLAQGMLESADGTSRLAVKGNNHFGIKCHNDWSGGKIYEDDDAKNECFRKYKHAEESYRDHSLFLAERSRYAALFELELTDYKGWAHGLQKAGYATSNIYAKTLIKLIEDFELHRFDIEGFEGVLLAEARILQLQNGAKFVILQEGETVETISKLYKRNLKQIMRYNDWRWDEKIITDERVFIRPKKNKGSTKFHKVAEGEDMHAIAQRYGIKLERLYWRNRKPVGWQPATGEILRLRGRVKK